jgi:hypothetical protein
MRQFYFPTQDASIYQEFISRETGLDEILEVGKNELGTKSIRSLIQFDIDTISASIANGTISQNSVFDLKLFVANGERLLRNQVVQLMPISESWIEGQGYYYQDMLEESQGPTWVYRYSGSLWGSSGSTFSGSPTSSATLTTPLTDVTFDVTSMILNWVSGTITNNGFLVRFPTGSEVDSYNKGKISFFSKDTHTVFSPTLIAKWDDSSRNTSSMSASVSSGLIVYPSNLRPLYNPNEVVRVDLVARKQYPLKTFSSTFVEWNNSYLPSSSYYSIVDLKSNEVIVPFDDYSKISVDADGNYFNFRVQKMYPRRYYKLMIKVISGGYTYEFDNNYYFRING